MKKVESTLSKMISTAGENAAYDNSCKRILSNKSILAWIMKSCMEEYCEYSVEEIMTEYIEGNPQISSIAVHKDETAEAFISGLNTEDTSINEGAVTYDIRFHAIVPGSGERVKLFINIEAQNDFYPGYPVIKRSIYYCGRMISSQYGTEFEDSHYENVKKVYSIFICTNPPNYRKNTINRYALKEENYIGNVKEKIENYDLITAVMICLGNGEESTGIVYLLVVLLSSELNAEEKKRILQEKYGIEMTKILEEEITDMCDLSKGIEAKAIQKGIQKGIQNGIQRERLHSLKTLMQTMLWTADQAMDALKIGEAERERFRAEL